VTLSSSAPVTACGILPWTQRSEGHPGHLSGVRTKADLALIADKEREDWQKRGASGTVTAIDSAARLSPSGGQRSPGGRGLEKTSFLRYAPDSQVQRRQAWFLRGNQSRRPGPRAGRQTGDGATIKAEKALSARGANLPQTITSINAATGEIVIKTWPPRKP